MRSDSQATVEDLLNVAERLFARHGVEHVALTKIVGSSGQRNRSALHYHFGSRDGLIAAVLGRRIQAINTLRNSLLDDPARQGTNLSDAVYAIIAPVCLTLNEPWGSDYISILAQVSFRPRPLRERVDDALLSSIRRCRRLVEEALPDIPPEVHTQRYRWLFDSVVLEVARWSRITAKAKRTPSAIEGLIGELVAYGTPALAAPHATRPGQSAPRQV